MKRPTEKLQVWDDVFDGDALEARRRLYMASVALGSVLIGGTVGYWVLGQGEWSLLDCVYMTVITLTTVGYGEVLPIEHDHAAKVFTIVLIVLGMGVVLYFVSSLTAFILEGSLRHLLRRKRMDRMIEAMDKHHIVCGAGGVGEHVIQELIVSKEPFVVVEHDPEHVERIHSMFGEVFPFVLGDATEDDALHKAGIGRAKSAIVALGDDHDNLFCTISIRTLNPEARIITRVDDFKSEPKFRRAGADEVIYTKAIAGRRMVSAVLRPKAISYLDLMLSGAERPLTIDEVEVGENPKLRNQSLRRAKLRQIADVLVVAIYDIDTGIYTYNPSPDFEMMSNHTLIVLGEASEVRKLDAHTQAIR